MHQRNQDIYASVPLRRLLDAQVRALIPGLQRCFGTHALLVCAASGDVPPAFPMPGCWTTLRLDGDRYRGDLLAAADEPLPFAGDAFGLIVLRHALETVPDARALLDEAVRVLAPGGVLAVTGVHPLSGWAPWLYWHVRGRPPVLQMPLRLRHRLQQAGLEIERIQRVGRMWPGLPATHSARAGAFGGGYVLVARKRSRMVTPLRIKPVSMRVSASGRFSPSTRRSAVS